MCTMQLEIQKATGKRQRATAAGPEAEHLVDIDDATQRGATASRQAGPEADRHFGDDDEQPADARAGPPGQPGATLQSGGETATASQSAGLEATPKATGHRPLISDVMGICNLPEPLTLFEDPTGVCDTVSQTLL